MPQPAASDVWHGRLGCAITLLGCFGFWLAIIALGSWFLG